MLYKSNLYLCYPSSEGVSLENKDPYTVVRIAGDGSSKEEIFRQEGIHVPLLHRGYMYYITTKYTVPESQGDGSAISPNMNCFRIRVEDKNPKEEVFFTPDEPNPGYTAMSGYGNYIFMSFDYSTGAVEYRYDIINNRAEPFEPEKPDPSRISMYKGSLYMSFYDENDPETSQKMLYRTDWNGKGAVPVISGLYEEFSIQTDGRYLYIDDSAYKMLEDPESDIHVQVYDENMEPVDEYIIPETKSYPMGGPVGGEKYQYLLFDDGETGEWGLYIWDKSEIGTLHGKPYTQQKVVYESRE